MSRGLIVTIIVLSGMAALGIYISGEKYLAHTPNKESAASPIPQPQGTLTHLPDFSLPDPAGEPQPSSRWAGKVLVLNFWATWCPPCRKEMPGFMELQQELGGKGLHFGRATLPNVLASTICASRCAAHRSHWKVNKQIVCRL